jgi:hypothetical protein
VRFFFGKRDIHTIFTHLDGEGLYAVVESARRLAGERMEVPTVPRATKQAAFDGAFPEWAALVRTTVV